MNRVRIVGGGLAGLIAAFQAHRMGARDIVLHEAAEELGGGLAVRVAHGLELRQLPFEFGPRGDAVRALFEDRGIVFEDFETRFASVSPAARGDITFTRDFPGPAILSRDLALAFSSGDSLADRLRAYPSDIGHALARYCQWRLGAWLDEVHESAASELGCSQVFPLGAGVVEIAGLKRSDPRADALYGVPGGLCGRLDHLTASLPRGGFAAFFAHCGEALERLGVEIRRGEAVTTSRALAERQADELVVWAADPAPLLALADAETPQPIRRPTATYLFKARYDGRLPFHVANFTGAGAVFGLHLYETRGQAVVMAQCVGEAPEAELRREIHRLLSGFGAASLALEDQVCAQVAPGRHGLTLDAARKLAALEAALARQTDGLFVAAWKDHAAVAPQVAAALRPAASAAAAA
jgi:hypothetical protein